MLDKESGTKSSPVQVSECASPPSSYALVGLFAGTTVTTEQIAWKGFSQ